MIGLDHRLDRWVVTHRSGVLNVLFEGLTYAGTQGLVWIVIAIAIAVVRRRPDVLLLVVGADAAAQLSAYALKALVGRDRPPVHHPRPRPLVHVPHSGSFPSGHAATSFACAAILASAEPRLTAPFLVLAAAIAFSRIYVGVHYPLDVVGGAVLGLAVATALRRLAGRLRRAAPARPPG